MAGQRFDDAFLAGRSLNVATTGSNYTLEVDDHLNASAYTALLNGDGSGP